MNNFPATPPSAPYISTRTPLSRRHFLRAFGIALSLPLLDSMRPVFAREAPARTLSGADGKPRRMLAICQNLGVLPDLFFPATGGREFDLPPYLKILAEHRRDFTVFSGLSHPGVDGSHASDVCFLTGAPHPGSSSFRNSVSLDQFIAERIGIQTRFPSLTLAVNTRTRSLSYSGTGVAIPPEDKASEVFRQLFLQGSPGDVDENLRQLDRGRSILDAVADHARALQRNAGEHDRDRLDQYFTSVRELENRMRISRSWELKPKPKVSAPMPQDPASPAAYMEKTRIMYDLARLAFETDSTRSITLMLDSVGSPAPELPGMTLTDGYHNLSHHGRSDDKRNQLRALDVAHMQHLSTLLENLRSTVEDGDTLLDRTMVLFGSNLGDANKHTTTNLPVLLAGGGFNHGQHLAFDSERNHPLPNLFVSMIRRMGIDADGFATATGGMRGLDLA